MYPVVSHWVWDSESPGWLNELGFQVPISPTMVIVTKCYNVPLMFDKCYTIWNYLHNKMLVKFATGLCRKCCSPLDRRHVRPRQLHHHGTPERTVRRQRETERHARTLRTHGSPGRRSLTCLFPGL